MTVVIRPSVLFNNRIKITEEIRYLHEQWSFCRGDERSTHTLYILRQKQKMHENKHVFSGFGWPIREGDGTLWPL